MNNQQNEFKIAEDVSWRFFYANLTFIGIMLLIYLALYLGLIPFLEESITVRPDFLRFSYPSTKLYLIIYGIIGAIYYFPMYVQLGATRKKTFKGTTVGLLVGVISLVILTVVVSEGTIIISEWFSTEISWDSSLYYSFVENDFLDNDTFLASIGRLSVTMFSFIVNALLNYSIGWMFGSAYYRGGFKKSINFIFIGLVTMILVDLLWGNDFSTILPRVTVGSNGFIQWLIAIVGSLILTGILLWIIRNLTKQITIKLN